MPANYIPIGHLSELFSVVFLLGSILALPLFDYNLSRFLKSQLFVKIAFWIPIFMVFAVGLYATSDQQLALLLVILAVCLREAAKKFSGSKYKLTIAVYFLIFGAAFSHLAILKLGYQRQFTSLLITVAIASVLADVTAFFFGTYLGKHKLPAQLNGNKSLEGVVGQLLGALLGVLVVNRFVLPAISIWLFLPIGFGSAAGDLANSFIKRKLGIKEWSHYLPGHGGFIDRFCSLAGSSLLTFYFLKLTGIV